MLLLVLPGGCAAAAGSLPAEWSRLSRLAVLSARSALLSGPLPPAWARLSALTYLDLAHNANISGGLPTAWQALGALQVLWVPPGHTCAYLRASDAGVSLLHMHACMWLTCSALTRVPACMSA